MSRFNPAGDMVASIFWYGYYAGTITMSDTDTDPHRLAHIFAHIAGPIPDPIFELASKYVRTFFPAEFVASEMERALDEVEREERTKGRVHIGLKFSPTKGGYLTR